MKSLRSESLAIAVFLAITLVFGFGLLPAGIEVGTVNTGTGLSPRFLPQLATAAIAIALAWGLIRASANKNAAEESAAPETGNARKPLIAATVCLAFATVGFDLAGFYLGGAVMAIMLTFLLGERRVALSILFPTLLLAAIYVVFEFGLQVRLPKSGFIPGLSL
jgi:hypothetical protein